MRNRVGALFSCKTNSNNNKEREFHHILIVDSQINHRVLASFQN